MFAYTFSAAPPFGVLATSREFRIQLPTARRLQAANQAARPKASLNMPPDGLLLPPTPVRAVHEVLRGIEGKPQFPVGIMWSSDTMTTSGGEGAGGGGADGGGTRGPDTSGARVETSSTQHAATHATKQGEPIGTLTDGDGQCVLLSWGHNDRETYSTTLPLRLLFGSAMEWVPLRAGDPPTTTDCS